MNAIILAAGVGKRLGKERPKSLIALGGRTLLSRSLQALAGTGVACATVVVGYKAELFEEELALAPPPLPVRLCRNPRFTEGAILSLHAAREELDGGALVMDADVLYDPGILADLVRCESPSAFLCDTSQSFHGEEMMLHGTLGRVTRIHRGIVPGEEVLGEAVGFLKVGGEAASRLRIMLEEAVAAGRTSIEHEELYDDFLRVASVAAVPIGDRPWIEIDFPEDIARAAAEVLPRIETAPGA